MTFRREMWKLEFTESSHPVWPCPACGGGRLRVRTGTLVEGEPRESVLAHASPDWEPDWIDGRFACMMECPNCQNVIGVAGKYRIKDERGYDPELGDVGDYAKYYRPSYFTDSPHLITWPDDTPREVIEELEAAFRLFWADAPACGNRIRSALEILLTAQRVPRTTGRSITGRKRTFLSLHSRLERFGERNEELAEAFMAVKWLGNAGSHASVLTTDDLLDGFEILEHGLEELYSKREARVRSLSRAINRRKAPRSRRRGSRPSF